MNPDRQQAIDYLRAPAGGVWHWAEQGAVVVWRDGTTIAFREEIVQILEWLAPNGLPSFGAIVFLLAACRGKVPAAAEILPEAQALLPPHAGAKVALLHTARRQLSAQLDAALAELTRLSRLAIELNAGVKARCVLAEAVFEPAKVERYVEARAVLRGLREPLNDADLVDPDRAGVSGGYIRQIHIVAEGLKLHTSESLALRLRTGMDALPEPMEIDLPPADRARRLIEEMSRDREHGAVARAARELMAAVRLPRRLGDREPLAVGGVADIANRGPLDRLLLSELAHDDLTLAARVALNEALYLRREPPMREPPGALALLLDSGVRLWGVPRVLATAVALALIARDRQHKDVLAWRAHGKELQAVDLLSRSGLTQHLASLETDAHPGSSLTAFSEAVSSDARNQSVLITHRDALEDPEFRRALAEHPAAPGFVAVVNREGRFELHALPLARRPPLCEADLDLASVFDEGKGVPPVRKEIDPDLPAIFGMSPFPFLLPVTGNLDFWIKATDGCTYAVTRGRQLVRFKDKNSGARVLAADLPGGATVWMDCVDDVVHVVKAGSNQRPARLASVRIPDGELRVFDLASGPELLAVHRYGQVILAIRRHYVRAYALGDGRLLNQTPNPHEWRNGRFFRGTSHFYFAAWDGERVKFEPVNLPAPYSASVIACVFDRRGMEGPWFVHRGGMTGSLAGSERQQLAMPPGRSFGIEQVRLSRDGHRVCLFLSAVQREWHRIHDLSSGNLLKDSPSRLRDTDLEPLPNVPTWNLYRVIDSISRMPDGLALRGRKDHLRKLALHANGRIGFEDVLVRDHSLGTEIPFSGTPKRTAHGCLLDVAQWPNGSKAFLDSRGLLHLKSHDPAVPEVSLVLAHAEIAGWTSDGWMCGPPFFFEGPYTSDPARVFERILQFVSRL